MQNTIAQQVNPCEDLIGLPTEVFQQIEAIRIELEFSSGIAYPYLQYLCNQEALFVASPQKLQELCKWKKPPTDKWNFVFQGINPQTEAFERDKNLQCKVNTPNPGDPDKIIKYLTPSKAISDAIFLPLMNGAWIEEILRTKEVWITEGGKKAASLISKGKLCVAVTGVWNATMQTKDGKARINLSWLIKFAAEHGIHLVLAFDADWKTNDNVKLAMKTTLEDWQKEGTERISVALWETGDKGIDDLIVAMKNDWEKHIEMKSAEKFLQSIAGQFPKQKPQKLNNRMIAELLVEQYRTDHKFHLEQKTWRLYVDGYWKTVEPKILKKMCKSTLDSKGIEYETNARLTDVISLLESDLTHQWQTVNTAEYINFSNGVYHIPSGELRNHESGYGFTSRLDREFKRIEVDTKNTSIEELLASHCPVFYYSYLDQFDDDSSKVLKLVAIINAMLTYRCYDLQFFLQLQGKPGSGKGTFARLLTDIVGIKKTVSASIKDLSSDYHLARIVPAQLVVCSDEDKVAGNYAPLKKLTGGDLISYRPIYGEPAEDYFRGLLVIINNNPLFAGDTTGLDRRICLIKFDRGFDKTDTSIEAAMKEEIDSLISISLMMNAKDVRAFIKEDIGTSSKHDKWLNKTETDSVAYFIEHYIAEATMNCCEQVSIHEKSLYEHYSNMCASSGMTKVAVNKFQTRFKEHLEFLGVEHNKEPKKKRMHGSGNTVPVIFGVALKANHAGFADDPTFSERLSGVCASSDTPRASTVQVGCASTEPLKNQECASCASWNDQPFLAGSEQQAIVQEIINPIQPESTPPCQLAQLAQPLENQAFKLAQGTCTELAQDESQLAQDSQSAEIAATGTAEPVKTAQPTIDLSKYGFKPMPPKINGLTFDHWAYKADEDKWVDAHVVKRGGATDRPIVRFITNPEVDVKLVRFEQVASKAQHPEKPTGIMTLPKKKKK